MMLMMDSSLRMQAVIATLYGFCFGQQTLIELFDNWVEARGGQRGHVEHAADAGAAAVDVPRPSLLAAVAIEWRHPNELADLLAIKRAQLRQVGEQGEGNHRTDARHTL